MKQAIFSVLLATVFGCSSSSTSGAQGDASSDVGGGDSAGGGACAGITCSGARVVCDPADGKCKLDGSTTAVGAPCSTSGADPACGTDLHATCNDLTADGFPGGYCSVEPCSTSELCPIGSTCAALGGESPACFVDCVADGDCRPGYECLDVDPHYVSGASHKVCFLKDYPCATNADCPASNPTCSGADGGVMGTCK